MNFKERLIAVWEVVAELSWRGFGILLYVIGGSGTMGAIVSGSPWIGILTAWGTLMLGLIGVIGYAIATTGKASKATVAKGAQDAIQKFEEKTEK
jgi:hypothetical protein